MKCHIKEALCQKKPCKQVINGCKKETINVSHVAIEERDTNKRCQWAVLEKSPL